MALSLEEKRLKQQAYNRQYYQAHRARKLEQNARSARRWREKYPDRYRLSQERCRQRARQVKGIEPRKPRVRECVACHQLKPHKARDMCVVCYGRWRWQKHKELVRSYLAEPLEDERVTTPDAMRTRSFAAVGA